MARSFRWPSRESLLRVFGAKRRRWQGWGAPLRAEGEASSARHRRHCEPKAKQSSRRAPDIVDCFALRASQGRWEATQWTAYDEAPSRRRSPAESLHAACPLRLHHGEQAQRDALHQRDFEPFAKSVSASRGPHARVQSRYGCKTLVFYEHYERMDDVIAREKQIKGGSRAKKIALIQAMNPEWRDLYDGLGVKATHSVSL